MMEETVRLFEQNGYAVEFTGRVLVCETIEEERFRVILDETLFFPEAGGQSADRGWLEKVKVLDVQIDQGIIYHYTDGALPEGETVHGKIDWEHRFSNMQQHSGEHIFSGTVHRLFGLNNVGFHLSDQTVTMDFDGPLNLQQLELVEEEVNQAIVRNVEIQVSYPGREELEALEYRSKFEIKGQVRIVTIHDYDVCACCAPHVKRTGEIGLLKIMGVQNHKGGIRVNILCGFRALEAFRQKNKVIASLTNLLSTNQEALPELIKRQKELIYQLKGELSEAKQKLIRHRIAELPQEQNHVLLFERDLETAVVRNVVNELTERHRGICGIFVEKQEGGYQFILGSKTINCKEAALLLNKTLKAKGGGSEIMVQGSVEASKEEIEEVLLAHVHACDNLEG
ncbi:MAG: alanyl-tRNA editing protein [Lachnospiraceae bacterium]|nr:alanyl-tRNA editing protein [Lachnospiraceae bacterium]